MKPPQQQHTNPGGKAMMDKSGRNPPHNREFHFSNKGNSEFKWKHDNTVIGALEVPSEPFLNLEASYREHSIVGYEDQLAKCIQIWNDNELKTSFVGAYSNLEPQTKCCGLFKNDDATVKHNVPILNDTWCKSQTETYFAKEGYRITCFIWRWSNPTGKSETVIPMIRFHSLRIKKDRNEY